MLVNNIRLKDYRNYDDIYLEFKPHLNLIVGQNGIGKTNILESIIFISNTKSFRTLKDIDLIKRDKEYARIILNSDKDEFKVVINKKNKTLFFNNNLIKRSSDYIGKINAVLFKPSDLELFDQSPKERRRLLDTEIGKISKTYLNSLLIYNKLLKDKNQILKEDKINDDLLNIIDEKMLPEMKNIINERERFFNYINKHLSNIYQDISGSKSKIEIIYKKCSDIDELNNNLMKSREKDLYYRYASTGTHLEDYYFKMNDIEINSIASQGQKRMTLIAFKFALIDYIKEETNEIPIVLLDDILSELDDKNIERLLNHLPDDCQIIITDTSVDTNIIKDYKLIELGGNVYG